MRFIAKVAEFVGIVIATAIVMTIINIIIEKAFDWWNARHTTIKED